LIEIRATGYCRGDRAIASCQKRVVDARRDPVVDHASDSSRRRPIRCFGRERPLCVIPVEHSHANARGPRKAHGSVKIIPDRGVGIATRTGLMAAFICLRAIGVEYPLSVEGGFFARFVFRGRIGRGTIVCPPQLWAYPPAGSPHNRGAAMCIRKVQIMALYRLRRQILVNYSHIWRSSSAFR